MNRSRTILGIAVLCALALSAFFAASAQAEQSVYTCRHEPGPREDPHCRVAAVGTGTYNTIWGGLEATGYSATNLKTTEETTASTTTKLKGNIAGIATEVQCTSVSATGELQNTEHGTNGTGVISYSGCSVTAPAGRSCVVKGGKITTASLKATTVGQVEANLKLSPASGTEFTKIALEGCKENKPPAAEYPVTGSVTTSTTGATAFTTEEAVTKEGTLAFGGNKAGIEGAVTLESKEGTPLLLMVH